MMYRYEHGWDAGGWVLMSVLMLVVLGAVIVSVLAVFQTTSPRSAVSSASLRTDLPWHVTS